jgi:hypothetical protein
MNQATISLGKKALFCVNATLLTAAGYLWYNHADAHKPIRITPHIAQEHQAPDPRTDNLPAATQITTAPDTLEVLVQKPATVDPRVTTLTLKGFDEYNALVPAMLKVSDELKSNRIDVPSEIIALTVLTETSGKTGRDGKYRDRYEPGFQRRYVDPLFDKWDKKANGYGLHMVLEKIYKRMQEQGSEISKDAFKAMLASSPGPAQVIRLTAYDDGFRGLPNELDDNEVNLRCAAMHIWRQRHQTSTVVDNDEGQHRVYDPRLVLRAYNAGNVDAKPTEGHVERGMDYWTQLQKNTLANSRRR